MKFRNQAPLCLAVFDFEAHIMLSLCSTFQGTGLLVGLWEKKLNGSCKLSVNLFLVISFDL